MRATKINYLLLFLIPLVVSIFAYESGVDFLLSKWLDFDHGAYNHGFLLLLVTLYLLYSEIDFNQDISTKASSIGFVAALLFMVLAFTFEVVSIVSLQVIAFYSFVVFLVLAVYGWEVFKKAIVPLGLMLFALPVWGSFGPILQKLTLEMSFLMVKAVGIPVLKEGFYITIPVGKFEVAPGCSGFSYFMAAFPLAILYAVSNFNNKKNIFLVVGVIVAASIIANWVRVFIIIVAGQLTDMQHYFVTVEHFNLGWVIFGFMFISLVFLFNRVLKGGEDREYANKTGDVGTIKSQIRVTDIRVIIYSVLLTVLLLIFLGLQGQKPEANNEVDEARFISGLFQQSPPLYQLDPQVNGAKEHIYVANEYTPPVQLYLLRVPRQTQGREVVSSNNRLFDEEKWHLISSQPVLNGKVNEMKIRSNRTGEVFLLWSWYRVNDRNTASDVKAKWYEFLGYLKGDNSGSIVSLMMPKTSGAKETLKIVYRLMEEERAHTGEPNEDYSRDGK